tara:strand:+ start:281 stop:535 length:255 start_codon:yes stop_codon:yes gene_type:complete
MKKLLLILFCAGLVGCAGNQKLLGENNSAPIKEVGSPIDSRTQDIIEISHSWWPPMIWFILILGGSLLVWREFKPSPSGQTNDS